MVEYLKFWHLHMVFHAYLTIGKHIKVSDWCFERVGCSEKATYTFSTNKKSVVAISSTWSHMVARRTENNSLLAKKLVKILEEKTVQLQAKRKRQAISEQQTSAKKKNQRYKRLPWKQMRNLPSAHNAWLLRTRNAGGVCSSVLMWYLGAPSILIVCYEYVQYYYVQYCFVHK